MAITYPSTIKTNMEQYQAVLSLKEQARLEYNRVGDKSAKTNYKKWLTFKKLFDEKETELLMEEIRLRDLLIKDSGIDLAKVPRTELSRILEPILGNKNAIKVLPTLATSQALTEIKAIDFDKLSASADFDPLEDFPTNWSETDPNSKLTVTTNQVAFAGIARGSGCFVTRDFGAGHFTTFEHRFSMLVSAQTTSWDSEFYPYYIFSASGRNLTVYAQNSGTDETDIHIYGTDPTEAHDQVNNLAVGTRYYYVSKRDATNITLKVYTGSDYTTGLVDTLAITKGDSTAFQNMAVMYATAGSGGSSTGAFNDLDVQEAAASGSVVPIIMLAHNHFNGGH